MSLTSFLLKSMEKVIDFHMRREILNRKPLCKEQHAYQAGKSTLQTLVRRVEKSIDAKEIALITLLDIEGAFDNTKYLSIARAAKKDIGPNVVERIAEMLHIRLISAQLCSDQVVIEAARVIVELMEKVNANDFKEIGYADQVAIIVRSKADKIILSVCKPH